MTSDQVFRSQILYRGVHIQHIYHRAKFECSQFSSLANTGGRGGGGLKVLQGTKASGWNRVKAQREIPVPREKMLKAIKLIPSKSRKMLKIFSPELPSRNNAGETIKLASVAGKKLIHFLSTELVNLFFRISLSQILLAVSGEDALDESVLL